MVRGVLDKGLDSEMQFKIQSCGFPDWSIYGLCYSGDGQGCRLLMNFLQKYKFYNNNLREFLEKYRENIYIIYNNIHM